MNRREAVGALAVLGTAPGAFAQTARVWKIGVLNGSEVSAVREKDFMKGMAELGYVAGRNVHYEIRTGDGTNETALRLAHELVAARVDLIWGPGTQVTNAARKATSTVPIVFSQVSDPVASGFVKSLARPGLNVTGITILNAETGAKRIELLHEIFPKLKRVAVLHNPADAASVAQLAVVEESLRKLDKQAMVEVASAPDQFAAAFANFARWRAEALVILENSLFVRNRKVLIGLATKNRWPTVNSTKDFAEDGGVISYGADWADAARRSAAYVDKILKGANPGDLPVERASRFELVVNLRAAKSLGLTIPRVVLIRADQVIE